MKTLPRAVLALLLVAYSTAVQAQTTAGTSTVIVVPVVAQTASFASEVTLFNPNVEAISVAIHYYDANNLTTAGPKSCNLITVPAGSSVQFGLAAQCTLESESSHFGLLVASEQTQTQEFHGYVRTQNPQGIGFSTEGFPREHFSDATAHATGLKRTAAAPGVPPFQTNCFAASLGQAVNYELRLFDGTSGAQIGSTVAGSLAADQQYRYLDVFGQFGVNAPAGDLTNVRAEFINLSGGGVPLIGFCTVQDNQTFSADFRIAKSVSAAVNANVCALGNSLATADSATFVGSYSSIALGADGLPVVSYYDNSNGDLKVVKCGNAACSDGNAITTVDSAGTVGWFTSITRGADGLPVISYYDYSNGDLKVAKCGNAACSSGNTITTVDSADNVGTYNSIRLGADGLPVISYYDQTNFDLKVAKCGDTACSSGNTISIVDSAGTVGGFTSITLGGDGLPAISYRDYTNAVLKVAKCGNAACNSGNVITIVDGTGNVGGDTSIALGGDGLPVISYSDVGNSDLKVAKCTNAACTGASTITTLDSAGDVGSDGTSIALGADGLPVISYRDATNVHLKVAKCFRSTCMP